MNEPKTPKLLGTPIWDAYSPPPRAWVVRMRNPFFLTCFDFLASEFSTWPPVLDVPVERLASMVGAACEFVAGEIEIPISDMEPTLSQEPPEFLHLMDFRTGNEWILEPHAPRLWRMRIDENDDCIAIQWWKGWGEPPEFPRDTRRVTEFHQSREFSAQTSPLPE